MLWYRTCITVCVLYIFLYLTCISLSTQTSITAERGRTLMLKYIEPCTLNISLSDLCFSQYPDQYHSGGHCQYTAVIEHDQVLEGTAHHLRHWQNHWYVQWDRSNPDTNGAEESVVVSEVS